VEFITVEHWDEVLWKKASYIYDQAFRGKGAKSEKIIRNMFKKNICSLHIGIKNSKVITMALIGRLEGTKTLLIDYLAVFEDYRNRGIGQLLLNYIKDWAIENGRFESIIIEVESKNSQENWKRIHFWEKCGFTLTDYVHHYIWVPEPYQAMYIKLQSSSILPEDGEQLFKYISHFHKLSYQGL
jgi:GNAT superfamily N-acetyltransferase